MKILHKAPALSFYMIHTGFLTFKRRIMEELSSTSGVNLDDVVDDDTLHSYYRSGESPAFVAAAIWGGSFED